MGGDQKSAGAQPCGQLAPRDPLAFLPGLNADGAPQGRIDGMRCKIDLFRTGQPGAVENFDRTIIIVERVGIESHGFFTLRLRCLRPQIEGALAVSENEQRNSEGYAERKAEESEQG